MPDSPLTPLTATQLRARALRLQQVAGDFPDHHLRQCLLEMATEMVAEADALERKGSATRVSLSETAAPRGPG
jgi:hypothetical protein